MAELIEIIEITFSPWEQKLYAQDNRQPALENLLERTAQLGVLLFSQPCTFQFAWQVKPNATTDFEIAISPRLLKINDEEANELERSQLMINIKTCRSSFVEDLVDSDLTFSDLVSYGSHLSHPGQAQHSVQSSVIRQMERHQTLSVDGVYRGSGEYIAETSDRGRRTAREAQIQPHVHELDSGSPGHLDITRCSEVLTPSAQDRMPPQLPPLHNYTPLNMFSELPATPREFSNSSARLPAVQGYGYGHQNVPHKDAADVTQHVVPHSISGPITTHEAFLHTKETRRKAAPCPPSSIQQFSTTQLPMGRTSSSRRRRSISASSDHRGRTSDTDLDVQSRRASFPNDRNATAHHIPRQPDTRELQQPNSRLDVRQSAPVNAERGRPVGDAHSIRPNGPGHEDDATQNGRKELKRA
ncbi:hypothetical protein LTR64_005067 [Lithohypha guttulata]|uniref:uncharacterized protein n=1 Tax=Lithohypha guttulata TaxID=1690604 RepID=UPI00315C91BB